MSVSGRSEIRALRPILNVRPTVVLWLIPVSMSVEGAIVILLLHAYFLNYDVDLRDNTYFGEDFV